MVEESSLEGHYVLVGLGNPGHRYERTRHNIGFLVANAVAQRAEVTYKEEKRFHALVAKGRFEGKTLHILLPQTYMNESGRSVGAYLSFYRLKPKDLIVISDDVELPFGELRLRAKGGSGGHNGLKSIEAHLGSQEYLRLKMGVGKALAAATLAEYVLDLFKPEEAAVLDEFIGRAAEVVKSLLCESSAVVMNRVNVKNMSPNIRLGAKHE
ncbi:MAG: aminoacyl-tRNA hydrolase [Parachlamydiaceae bacterium]|nr:aminoacyl-tRNA hydrolase [Parachlamydiaceae bacterium]